MPAAGSTLSAVHPRSQVLHPRRPPLSPLPLLLQVTHPAKPHLWLCAPQPSLPRAAPMTTVLCTGPVGTSPGVPPPLNPEEQAGGNPAARAYKPPPTPSPLSCPLARWEHLLLALGGHRVSCVPREGRQRVPWEEPGTSRLRLARQTGRARSPYRLCVSTGWTPCRERVHTTHTAGPRY